MSNAWRLWMVSDAICFADNIAGLYSESRQHGWDKFYGLNPSGDPNVPSLDQSIETCPRWVDAWGTGMFPPGQEALIGHYHDGTPAACTPRGPGAFALFGQLYAATGGLTSWVSATRARTDACRGRGGESAIYLGGPPLTAFSSSTSSSTRSRILAKWTTPIVDAGFDRVMMDLVSVTRQTATDSHPVKTPAMYWAEDLLREGIAVDVEGVARCEPSVFSWHDGRFGHVAMPGEWWKGPGWFNYDCPGIASRWFTWLQGSIPPAERAALAQQELAAGRDVIVEFAGLPVQLQP